LDSPPPKNDMLQANKNDKKKSIKRQNMLYIQKIQSLLSLSLSCFPPIPFLRFLLKAEEIKKKEKRYIDAKTL
jgi:hypothetical protein